jgi:hypothetical protein
MSEESEEAKMAEVSIQLFGGEQDGYRTSIDLRGDIPSTFFIWRAVDNETIALATGKKRMMLADKLAVLAYRLADRDGQPSTAELRYVRRADADKKLADPAV